MFRHAFTNEVIMTTYSEQPKREDHVRIFIQAQKKREVEEKAKLDQPKESKEPFDMSKLDEFLKPFFKKWEKYERKS